MDLFSRVHALAFLRLSACCLFAALQGIMLNSLAVRQLSINQRILFFPTFPSKLHQQINQSGIDNSHEAFSWWKGIPARLPRGEKQRKYLFKLEVISFILRRVDDESCFGCERTLPHYLSCVRSFSVNILIEFAHLKSFHSAA